MKVRMDDMARQLTHTNYSILSIAEDCGFATFSNFMVLFKKVLWNNAQKALPLHSFLD